MSRRQFGTIRKLRSGRWQARYPDGAGRLITAPQTFATKGDAGRFLDRVRTELEKGTWIDPRAGARKFDDYTRRWLEERPGLRPRTRELYDGLLRIHIFPTFGDALLNRVTSAQVRSWHAKLTKASHPGPSTIAKAYRLLRSIFATAVEDELIAKNPCTLKKAGVERPDERPVVTVEQVFALADAIEPRFRVLVLIAAFGALRLGELQGLRRRRVDVRRGKIDIVEQAQVLKDGTIVTGPPKSDAGIRTVTLPDSLLPELRAHMKELAGAGRDGLVFCGADGQHFRRASFYTAWRRACTAVGITGVRPHDLRHTGNTLAASTGASTKELMGRLGQSSPRAALMYQHRSRDHDEEIARALEALIQKARKAPRKLRSVQDEAGPAEDVARGWHAADFETRDGDEESPPKAG